jgi:hypothetical protein
LREGAPSTTGFIQAVGPGLCGVSISADVVERVIYILDKLARLADTRGIQIAPAEKQISAIVGVDRVSFELKEKTKQVPHVLNAAEIAQEEKRRKSQERWSRGLRGYEDIDFSPRPPEYDTVGTGELGIEVHEWGRGLRKSWRDGKMQVVENLLEDVVSALEAYLVAARVYREKREQEEAEQKEIDRRRALQRARKEREASRRAFLAKLLRTERRADELREWLKKRGNDSVALSDPDTVRLLHWAKEQLNTLETIIDPLRVAEELRSSKLFPSVDDLHDPFGDPPTPKYPWG